MRVGAEDGGIERRRGGVKDGRDTESPVVGSLSMGIASVMSRLSFLLINGY